MASSMTMPTASVRPSIVRLLSVMSRPRMAVNVAMIEIGTASAAMIVLRKFRMNSRTTMLASNPPIIRCSLMASTDALMKRD